MTYFWIPFLWLWQLTVLHYWFSLFVCICLLHTHTNIIRRAFVLTWKLYCKVTNIVSSRCLKPACEVVILWDGITLQVHTWTQMAVILQSCCFPTVSLYHLYYRWITGKLTKEKKNAITLTFRNRPLLYPAVMTVLQHELKPTFGNAVSHNDSWFD